MEWEYVGGGGGGEGFFWDLCFGGMKGLGEIWGVFIIKVRCEIMRLWPFLELRCFFFERESERENKKGEKARFFWDLLGGFLGDEKMPFGGDDGWTERE